jgi:hypothetical protein
MSWGRYRAPCACGSIHCQCGGLNAQRKEGGLFITDKQFIAMKKEFDETKSKLTAQLSAVREHCRLSADDKIMDGYSHCCQTSGMVDWTEELWNLLRENV